MVEGLDEYLERAVTIQVPHRGCRRRAVSIAVVARIGQRHIVEQRAVSREDLAYVFEDTSETPCRTSRIKSLASSISKARQSK